MVIQDVIIIRKIYACQKYFDYRLSGRTFSALWSGDDFPSPSDMQIILSNNTFDDFRKLSFKFLI